jgi:hypothetical protein
MSTHTHPQPTPLLPLLAGVLLATAVLLIGGGVITLMDVRQESARLGAANWKHCHKAKGTPEFQRFGCDEIRWGHLGQP